MAKQYSQSFHCLTVARRGSSCSTRVVSILHKMSLALYSLYKIWNNLLMNLSVLLKCLYYLKRLVQPVLGGKPDIAVPNSVQLDHWCCCNPDVNICYAAAIFGEGSSQVPEAIHLLELYSIHKDLCFAVAIGVTTTFLFVGDTFKLPVCC